MLRATYDISTVSGERAYLAAMRADSRQLQRAADALGEAAYNLAVVLDHWHEKGGATSLTALMEASYAAAERLDKGAEKIAADARAVTAACRAARSSRPIVAAT